MKRYIASLGIMVGVACGMPTDACGCSPPQAQGVVAGLVMRSNGTPVPNAEIRAEVRLFGCSGPVTTSAHPPLATTDDAGRYRYEMFVPFASDTACVRLVARAPASSGGDSTAASNVRMRFRYPSSGLRPDSVRVDLRLP